jgi:predicted MFS family arabinose efflux permease
MIVGMATLVLVILVLKLQPITAHLDSKTEKNAFLHLWNTIKNRNYRIGFATTALLSLGGFMMMPWGSAFAINNLKVTNEQLPILFMVAGIATLIIMPVIGKMSDKLNKMTIFTFASIWMILVVVIYTNMGPTPLWLVIIVNIAMMIGIMGRMVPSMALVTALPEMHDRGAFMSINSSLQQLAGGIASIIGGLIVVQQTKMSPLEHYNTLGYVVVVFAVLNIFMLQRVSKMAKVK